ncbi:IS66 family insertion sequence element accessory protein TnpB [Delftia tsuruhatensis]
MLYKRLESGTFMWPSGDSGPRCITRRQLSWLLEGLHVEQRQAHLAL